MARITFINPRFEPSFWGMEYALLLFGKKAMLPVASLTLLAALTPPEHDVTLIDENVEPLDFDALAQADIVGITGMNVQRVRMTQIMKELRARGVFVVAGGPWASVEENYFETLADVTFVGEAEQTWPRFLRDWQTGAHCKRYEQEQRTDMSKVPCPRYDLLPVQHYWFAGLQFTRGCPFQCEFCDIIVTFGRRPRLKTPAQIIAELEALRRLGLNLLFIVDDNLIGNKKAVKELLRHVIQWQRDHDYVMTFFTEATLDLAEDDELMQLMVDANIQVVFIGIESPNQESLRETRKLQNLRGRAGTMLERIHRIQRSGLEIWCGMVLGFDHDDATIFDEQVRFLTKARIVHAMMSMLVAIPKTPLYKRLAAADRLDETEASRYGTNIIPLRLGRKELSDGYVQVMKQLYDPQAYFQRADSICLDPEFEPGAAQRRYESRHPWLRFKRHVRHWATAAILGYRIRRVVQDPELRRFYLRKLAGVRAHRRDPHITAIYALKCAAHYHYYQLVQHMDNGQVPGQYYVTRSNTALMGSRGRSVTSA